MPVSGEEREKLRQQIENLELYLFDKQNVSVVFGQDCENCLIDNDLITISTRQNLRYQLHSLLHEAGHVLLRKNKKQFQKKFPGVLKIPSRLATSWAG
jgi:Zn-dependent peptidase ImmA (M78 family)